MNRNKSNPNQWGGGVWGAAGGGITPAYRGFRHVDAN